MDGRGLRLRLLYLVVWAEAVIRTAPLLHILVIHRGCCNRGRKAILYEGGEIFAVPEEFVFS